MIRRLLLFTTAAFAASAIYLPGFTNAPLADDWAVIQRNRDVSLQDLPHLLTATHGGWYRPVFDLFISVCAQFFGFKALGYHIVAFVLYLVVAVLAADIIGVLTQCTDVGALTAVLFGVHGAHAEPVLWVSASNELLARLFVLLGLRSYLAFRASSSPGRYYALRVLYTCNWRKRNRDFLPVALAVYDLSVQR